MPDDVTEPQAETPATDDVQVPAVDPATAPADDGQEQEGSKAETPATDDEMSVFAFTDADADGEGGQAAEGEGAGEGEQDAAEADAAPEGWALPEDCGIPAEMHGDIGKLVGKHKLDGKAAAAFLADAMAYAKEQEMQGHREVAAMVRQKWGNQFEAKLNATKAWVAKAARGAVIPIENMQFIMSPYGMMLMNEIREWSGDPGKLAGKVGERTPQLTNEQQVDEIYNNPELYEALVNPSNPRYREINDKVNRLMGIKK